MEDYEQALADVLGPYHESPWEIVLGEFLRWSLVLSAALAVGLAVSWGLGYLR